MTVTLKHILVPVHDREASACFVADVLGVEYLGLSSTARPPAFARVQVGYTTLDFADADTSTPLTTPSRSARTSSTPSSLLGAGSVALMAKQKPDAGPWLGWTITFLLGTLPALASPTSLKAPKWRRGELVRSLVG